MANIIGLLFAFLFCSCVWSCNSEEAHALSYLKTLNIRYPKFGEDALPETYLELGNMKSSLKEMLDKTFIEKGEIPILCGGPAKFFVVLCNGEKISNQKEFRAFSSSPYLAHIAPNDECANNFISETKTHNRGLWLARTAQGWLGLSSDGLLILDSEQWKKRLVQDLKKDFENQENSYFNLSEREKILKFNLLSLESWSLYEVYIFKNLNARVLSQCPDSGWPDERCLKLNDEIIRGIL